MVRTLPRTHRSDLRRNIVGRVNAMTSSELGTGQDSAGAEVVSGGTDTVTIWIRSWADQTPGRHKARHARQSDNRRQPNDHVDLLIPFAVKLVLRCVCYHTYPSVSEVGMKGSRRVVCHARGLCNYRVTQAPYASSQNTALCPARDVLVSRRGCLNPPRLTAPHPLVAVRCHR